MNDADDGRIPGKREIREGHTGPESVSADQLSNWKANPGVFDVQLERCASGNRHVVEGWLGSSSPPRDSLSRNVQRTAGDLFGGGFDGGHLIARRFGGPDVAGNVVPMEARFNRSVLATLEYDMLERLKNGPVYVRAEAVVGVDKSVSVVYRLFEPDKNGEPVEVSTVFSRADTRISDPLSSLRANDGASFRDAKKRLPK